MAGVKTKNETRDDDGSHTETTQKFKFEKNFLSTLQSYKPFLSEKKYKLGQHYFTLIQIKQFYCYDLN